VSHADEPLRAATSHGASTPRGLDAAAADVPGRGRFGRMFPCLPAGELTDATIDEVVATLLEAATELRENDAIPAGYTYLGQFVDHDLTFDPSSLGQRTGDPQALADFRTPRLDLDSMYGSGPSDQPFLYEWADERDRGVKLLVERRRTAVNAPPKLYFDLPRNAQGRALIGDPRNDENLIVAQLHLLFMQFHNAVVDHLRDGGLAGPALLREAQRVVRWHYQWIVTHDFLSRVAGGELAGSLVAAAVSGAGGERRCFCWDDEPFMPVEFSGAAYRFGHSMVRPGYLVNSPDVSFSILPLSATKLGLRGLRRLPSALVIDWRFFFELAGPPRGPQASTRIDPIVARRLFDLPPDIGTDAAPQLPRLNLLRGRRLRLPSGPDVARAMGIEPLDATGLQLSRFASESVREALLRAAPLWYYVLCEADARHEGKQLGPVGGRIVAEVLVGLLEGDAASYVHAEPAWTPTLPCAIPGDFTMGDLVRFTHPEYRDG
jgi:hypothetical protein